MKKKLTILYIAVFVLICCVPAALKPFSGGGRHIGNEQENPPPQLLTESGVNLQFSKECDTWISKENPLRVPMINAENTLRLDWLRSSGNGVIQGKNGYLFSEETLDDYLGKTLSPRTLYRIARTVRLTQDAAERAGSRFVFTVAPNKNTLYPSLMPARYIKGEVSNLSLLEEEFRRQGVHYLDLKAALSGQEQELYLRSDTHWNSLGALYGFQALMDFLGRPHNDYAGAGYTFKNNWTGDLTNMAFPESGRTCGQYYFDHDTRNWQFMQPRGDNNQALLEELMGSSEKRDAVIRVNNPDGLGSLYMLRDSYGRALIPFLAEQYQRAVMTRFYPISIQDGYDDIVWETAERGLHNAVSAAPVAFAALCSSPEKPRTLDSAENRAVTDDSAPGRLKICGTVDSRMLTDSSNLYVLLQSASGSLCYEAFPVYEQEQLGGGDCDNGFSVLLNTAEISAGTYAVTVVSDGENAAQTQVLQTIDIQQEERIQ